MEVILFTEITSNKFDLSDKKKQKLKNDELRGNRAHSIIHNDLVDIFIIHNSSFPFTSREREVRERLVILH